MTLSFIVVEMMRTGLGITYGFLLGVSIIVEIISLDEYVIEYIDVMNFGRSMGEHYMNIIC